MNNYDVIIIGAGPGGIFGAYELIEKNPDCKIAVFEAGHELAKRKCPIDGKKIKSCISCKSCSIMSGFGGAGAFSDGKYNITNDFGGTLYEHIGKQPAIDLMEYVDEINMKYGGEGTKLYSTAGTKLKKVCMQNKLKLLDASVRHLGTDINYVVLENMYAHLKDKVDFYFDTPVESVEVLYDENTAGADACSLQEAHTDNVSGYAVKTADSTYESRYCIISVGRSGSKWMEKVCNDLDIPTKSILKRDTRKSMATTSTVIFSRTTKTPESCMRIFLTPMQFISTRTSKTRSDVRCGAELCSMIHGKKITRSS